MNMHQNGLAAVSSLALLLAACGTEDTGTSPTEPPPAETETETETDTASTEMADPAPAPEPEAAEPEAEGPGTIVDIAAGNEDFATLVAAVQAAGLVDTLNSEGPFTVFAPTNDAFAALPEGTVDSLLQPENKDQLVAVLTYHVVPGKVMSADLAGAETTTATVQGAEVTIDATGDSVMVGDATVTAADIEASNGVIHVIDTVILPPSDE